MNSVRELREYPGQCHCGAVQFRVAIPPTVTVYRCNCSICTKTGFRHLIVAGDQLKILSGEDQLRDYRFNTRTARHLFCQQCGIKPFYVPRSHPDGYSVNFHCLELDSQVDADVRDFDGRHWGRSIDSIKDPDA